RLAEPAHLTRDRPAGLLFPLPHAPQELFATDLLPRLALLRQLALHHVLGRDAGVVGAGEPQGSVPLHTAAANDRVLDRVVEAVPHVEDPGDVRRRKDDAERLAIALGSEHAGTLPIGVDAFLHALRVVRLRKLVAHFSPWKRNGTLVGSRKGNRRRRLRPPGPADYVYERHRSTV